MGFFVNNKTNYVRVVLFLVYVPGEDNVQGKS